jgi:GTP pyrophosphokinase
VTVHKKTCSVAESIASKHGDWVVVPQWEESAENKSFLVRLSLKGLDRIGLLNEISRFISLVMGVNMRKIFLSVEGGIFEGYIDLYVHDKDVLERVIKRLTSIDGIESVVRTEI